MSTRLGSGAYTYELVEGWGIVEGGPTGDVASVSVDADDNVYVFHRGPDPMMVFNRAGELLTTWGQELFTSPHGTFVAPDQTIFCIDDGDHTVRHCTLDGQLLCTYGTPHQPAPFHSGRPFNRCTHAAMSPSGELYVCDGYGNARIHKYDPDGRPMGGWGRAGSDPGLFNLPHNICCDADGLVYVADRENHRIQVFDSDGGYLRQWNNLHRPSALCLSSGAEPVAFIGEIGPYLRGNHGWPNLGPRVSICAMDGSLLARLEPDPAAGPGAGQFLSPHGIAVDSHGDLYIAEVGYTGWPSLFPGVPAPTLICLKKYARVARASDGAAGTEHAA